MFEKLIIFLLFSVIITRTAHAYLDPGTGSMLIQMISALLLTGLVTIKVWFGVVKNLFSRKPKVTEDTKVNEEQPSSK